MTWESDDVKFLIVCVFVALGGLYNLITMADQVLARNANAKRPARKKNK